MTDTNGVGRAIDADAGRLDAVRRQRSGVRLALDDLERAVTAPSAGREAEWADNVLRRAGEMKAAFAEHIDVTERPGGLFDEVVDAAPRLSNKVAKLRDEHVTITADLDALATTAPADLREAVVQIMGRVVRHRSEGSDLIYDAYFVDIDAAD
jgi:hypothetical protein